MKLDGIADALMLIGFALLAVWLITTVNDARRGAPPDLFPMMAALLAFSFNLILSNPTSDALLAFCLVFFAIGAKTYVASLREMEKQRPSAGSE